MSDHDAAEDLGTCCACGGTEGVRHILMLRQKSPIPGRGWGCFCCDLPADGGVAVVCDACCGDGGGVLGKLRWACAGYPREDGRVPYSELTGTHEHDMSRHPEASGGEAGT